VPTELTAAELGLRLARREFSAVEVAQSYLDRIARLDSHYDAFLTVDPEWTLAQAQAAQALLDRGEGGPLTGVPIAVKDNMSTEGVATTCGSKILEGYVPPFDATVIARLKEVGMPILGKTNLDEFAMGGSTEYSAFKPTRNPWDTGRSPGGSSGGSAAAVCASLTPLGLGSDTGGSIRQPASLCGVVGFKPTYGRVSRYGLVAFGSSLDQIGPLARTVEDAALVAATISGHDGRDSTSLPNSAIHIDDLKSGRLKGLKAALPRELFSDALQPGVRSVLDETIATLTKEGVEFGEVDIPSIEFGVSTYYIIGPCEASSNLGRFDGVRFGPRAEADESGHVGMVERTRGRLFGKEVIRRIMIGTYALSAGYYDAYYVRAQQVRTMMRQEFDAVFRDYDLVLSPTSPVVAFKIGELSNDTLALKLTDLCTIPVNMGGYPAISLNGGFAEGLPVGVQLIGPTMADERVLQTAWCVEKALPDATRKPPMP